MTDFLDFAPNMVVDTTVSDPLYLDPDYPFEQFVSHFMSKGSVVHATVWIAQGQAPKGTVILSPQLFGGDRLESLIIPLMTAGINVLTFHPRGMWDNQHVYSLTSAVDDVRAAVGLLQDAASGKVTTLQGRSWRVDPERIAAMGLSGGGGNVAIAACAEDAGIAAAVAMAPNSMIGVKDPATLAASAGFFDAVKRNTAGRIDMNEIMLNTTPEDDARLDPIMLASHMTNKKVLLVGAHRDAVSPIETSHKPIAAAFRKAGVKGFDDIILESDHAFLTKRIALGRLVIGWLRTRCAF